MIGEVFDNFTVLVLNEIIIRAADAVPIRPLGVNHKRICDAEINGIIAAFRTSLFQPVICDFDNRLFPISGRIFIAVRVGCNPLAFILDNLEPKTFRVGHDHFDAYGPKLRFCPRIRHRTANAFCEKRACASGFPAPVNVERAEPGFLRPMIHNQRIAVLVDNLAVAKPCAELGRVGLERRGLEEHLLAQLLKRLGAPPAFVVALVFDDL